jgi:hypothetical protein
MAAMEASRTLRELVSYIQLRAPYGKRKADLVITDPPYNVVIDGHATGNGKVRHREFSMASGEMNSVEFTDFLPQGDDRSPGPQRHWLSCLLLHGLAAHD